MTAIETMTFRLLPSADPLAFIDIDADVQTEFSYQQAGIIRRTIARSDDDAWLILTLWASTDAADDAAEAFSRSPLHAPFTSMIDSETTVVHRYAPAGAA
jgi:hypothetical protein